MVIKNILDNDITDESKWILTTDSKKYKVLQGEILIVKINHEQGKYAIIPWGESPVLILETTDQDLYYRFIRKEHVVILTFYGWHKILLRTERIT